MTAIQWTGRTWNPLIGCFKISPGCRECYAETVAAGNVRRLRGIVAKGNASERTLRTLAAYERVVRMDADNNPLPQWSGEVALLPDRLDEPTRWRAPGMVFVNSMSDLFHEAVPFEYVAQVFAVMAASPKQTFQLLTKRPERALEFFAWLRTRLVPRMGVQVHRDRLACVWESWRRGFQYPARGSVAGWQVGALGPWPLPNVWIGVSAENQLQWTTRTVLLRQMPAAVHWVSAEPLLERIVGGAALTMCHEDELPVIHGWTPRNPDQSLVPAPLPFHDPWVNPVDWVVIGGESGPAARPCDRRWVGDLVGECLRRDVPVFVKQLGSRPCDVSTDGRTPVELRLRDRKGGDPEEWPEDLRIREWPKAHTRQV